MALVVGRAGDGEERCDNLERLAQTHVVRQDTSRALVVLLPEALQAAVPTPHRLATGIGTRVHQAPPEEPDTVHLMLLEVPREVGVDADLMVRLGQGVDDGIVYPPAELRLPQLLHPSCRLECLRLLGLLVEQGVVLDLADLAPLLPELLPPLLAPPILALGGGGGARLAPVVASVVIVIIVFLALIVWLRRCCGLCRGSLAISVMVGGKRHIVVVVVDHAAGLVIAIVIAAVRGGVEVGRLAMKSGLIELFHWIGLVWRVNGARDLARLCFGALDIIPC
mmetsp:Transcript_19487/g.54199  ORF Transcript_19487/g.54199 Transcript_19487/m.54199 type:complete len:280 (-) Transcript_19487:386-1225(-)